MAKRRRRNKKWIGVALFLVLMVIAGVVCFLVYESYFKEKEVAPEPEVPVVIEPEKEEEVEEVVTEKEEIVQYEGEDPNVADDLTGVVTYVGVNDGILKVRVNIDQYLAGGSCSLALMQGGATIYTDEAGVIDSVSTATCQGFDVPVSDFSSGATQIVITVNSGGKTGVIEGKVDL